MNSIKRKCKVCSSEVIVGADGFVEDHHHLAGGPFCAGSGKAPSPSQEQVDHPAHYGGKDNPYEAIKVIEAWELGFCLGNTVKYICRAGKKDGVVKDLKKARWYLDREIARRG